MEENINMDEIELTKNVKINIEFTIKKLVLLIYNQAILEGIPTTYSMVESMVNGGIVMI